MALDRLRVQRHHVHHQIARAGREAIADRKQVPSIALFLLRPRRMRQLVGHPLHEQRRAVMAGRIAHRRINRAVDVPFDGRKFRQPACSNRPE